MTQVQLILDEDDAIIVFEVLGRLSDKPTESATISEPELKSIDALVCALESTLTAPFEAGYSARIDQILSNRQRPSKPEEEQ
ncbi:hypothetical protein D3C72_1983380 [compost metagenome]